VFLRPRPAWLLAASAVLLSLALAACGGSSSPNPASATDNEQQFVKFAKCLREHGVNVSTPTTGGGGQIRITDVNPQKMDAAQNACKRYRPSGGKQNLTPQERVAREEQVQKFAKCMREHGVNIPAPSTAGGGIRIRLKRASEGGAGGPNPESPVFQAAQKACQGLLPFKRGTPGGPALNSVKGGKTGGAGLAIGG
jgi:hypothetical protein